MLELELFENLGSSARLCNNIAKPFRDVNTLTFRYVENEQVSVLVATLNGTTREVTLTFAGNCSTTGFCLLLLNWRMIIDTYNARVGEYF